MKLKFEKLTKTFDLKINKNQFDNSFWKKNEVEKRRLNKSFEKNWPKFKKSQFKKSIKKKFNFKKVKLGKVN